ncbi:glutathione S-transferase family protein [Roseomonas marmotae]|uniref:Glutathione S-transferase n=1 Tax=Roseomonas marmotae TaxID=2768161 RepID=A0ABS3KET5_9PROT|nr:glutathione S-transferase [Roseomonas marmotae]MBO1075974.1 glutathione S-transferase [Roseomonas marmotae]QTI80108.1 glutathione S-transferase [Roseomonas marmotae]
MKLHWCPKTRSFRALWMLEEAGAAYERVLVDIRAGAQQDPAFLALNPMAKVPVLEHGAIIIADSTAICAWLADRLPEAGLAPSLNHTDRGSYLQWLIFPAAYMEPALVERQGGWKTNTHAHAWGDFDRVLAAMDAGLQKGPWLLGEHFSAADVTMGTGLGWGLKFGMIPATPLRTAYIERCEARPAYQRALAIDAGPEEAAPPPAGPKPPQD